MPRNDGTVTEQPPKKPPPGYILRRHPPVSGGADQGVGGCPPSRRPLRPFVSFFDEGRLCRFIAGAKTKKKKKPQGKPTGGLDEFREVFATNRRAPHGVFARAAQRGSRPPSVPGPKIQSQGQALERRPASLAGQLLAPRPFNLKSRASKSTLTCRNKQSAAHRAVTSPRARPLEPPGRTLLWARRPRPDAPPEKLARASS